MKVNKMTVLELIRESLRKKLILEGNFSDALAGKMAYIVSMGVLIVSARRHLEQSISENPEGVSVFGDIVSKINLGASPSSNSNLVYDSIKFLESFINSPSVDFGSTIEKYIVKLKKIIDSFKSTHEEIKAELDETKNRVDKFPDRRLTKTLQGFSGILNINASAASMVSGSGIARGAAYQPDTQEITINLSFIPVLFNLFDPYEADEKIAAIFRTTMKWTQLAIQEVKGSVTHELVHSSQLEDFDDKTGFMSMVKGMVNPVKQSLAVNLKNFDDVDKVNFNLLNMFQEKLEELLNEKLGGFLSSPQKLFKYDLTAITGRMDNPWSGINRIPKKREDYIIAVCVTYFSILANVFSPQESEAYVRGEYVRLKNHVLKQNKTLGDKSPFANLRWQQATRDLFKKLVEDRYASSFNPDNTPDWVKKILEEELSVDIRNLYMNARGGYMRVYDSIYG